MATKPAKLPRWSETTGGVQSNVVEPSEGKKDVGFTPAERPAAQFFDWLLNLIYLWLKWLDVTVGTKQVVRVARRRAANLGAAFLVNTSTGAQIAIDGTSFQRLRDLDGSGFAVLSNTGAPRLVVPITLEEGEQLEEVRARALVYNTACTLQMKVYKVDISSGTPATFAKTQLGATVTVAANLNRQTMQRDGLTELATSSDSFTHVVEFAPNTFNAGWEVQSVHIFTSVPTAI